MTESDAAYFDNNATTSLDPRVLEAMLPWLGRRHGNPSSIHRFGRDARRAVEAARRQVASSLGARAADVVFTSSGTEANNAVLFGAAARCDHRGHLVLSAFEHPSVTGAVGRLERRGMTAARIWPREDGVLAVEDLVEALQPDTRVLCLMLANNELGTLQPVAEVAEECRRRGVLVLCDAVQALGKVEVDVETLGVDYLVVAGHKFHGPLGVAALWIRPDAPFDPWLAGAGQENGRRPSTENVPGMVGLGAACEVAKTELRRRHRHLLSLRQRLEDGLREIPGVRLHCAASPRLPHTTNAAFLGAPAQLLIPALDTAGFAVSAGAACGAGKAVPSPTLKALGLEDEEALATLRISFGMENRLEEVEAFLSALPGILGKLRATSEDRPGPE